MSEPHFLLLILIPVSFSDRRSSYPFVALKVELDFLERPFVIFRVDRYPAKISFIFGGSYSRASLIFMVKTWNGRFVVMEAHNCNDKAAASL